MSGGCRIVFPNALQSANLSYICRERMTFCQKGFLEFLYFLALLLIQCISRMRPYNLPCVSSPTYPVVLSLLGDCPASDCWWVLDRYFRFLLLISERPNRRLLILSAQWMRVDVTRRMANRIADNSLCFISGSNFLKKGSIEELCAIICELVLRFIFIM